MLFSTHCSGSFLCCLLVSTLPTCCEFRRLTVSCSDFTHWRQCVSIEGCVYIPQSQPKKLSKLPELHSLKGCVPEDLLLAEVPSGVELLDKKPDGEALQLLSHTGRRWLPLGELCTVDHLWTAEECAQKCPPDLSWQSCIKQKGCVYVYAASRNNPAKLAAVWPTGDLMSLLSQCAAANGLLGSSPLGTVWSPPGKRDGVSYALEAKAFGGQEVALVFPKQSSESATAGSVKPCVEGVDAVAQPPVSSWPAITTEHILEACRCRYWRLVAQMGQVLEIETDYSFAQHLPSEFLQVEYGCWRNVLSKSIRMPVQFEYIASADTGNEPRHHSFELDETPGLLEWQPPRWSRSDRYGVPYDVGHLVMANHFDGDEELIEATNLMTNVVPQHRDMNRFAWLATEMLTECARKGKDRENVFVIGGCVWNSSASFVKGFQKMEEVGYRLLIPDFCWKMMATPKRGVVAFWIPNTPEARISKKTGVPEGEGRVQEGLEELSKFVVSVADLEELLKSRQTPQLFALSAESKARRPSAAELFASGWSLDCDMS